MENSILTMSVENKLTYTDDRVREFRMQSGRKSPNLA